MNSTIYFGLLFTVVVLRPAPGFAQKHTGSKQVTPSIPIDTGLAKAITAPAVPVQMSRDKVFGDPEQQPEYPGGTPALYRFITTNLKMPGEAKRAGVSGRVYVSFLVEETGKITDVKVLKRLGFGCDEEAVRLVESMPEWKPGKLFGKPQKVRYFLPISFVN
ncbi:energy transducer TonB [Dyadobacter sp. 676]|uniref:Energy transducer TonB n=1 Tax=Dyadobacter sp. 676 TaxID=3088362 RepID=A0AAU8FIN0_9BACT